MKITAKKEQVHMNTEQNQQTDHQNREASMAENIRVQKTVYVKERLEQQHAAEKAALEQLLQEQKVIDDMQESMADSMGQTAETRKYNEEFKERINAQIYAMYDVTPDKLEGMREYKNAYYRGFAASFFLLSAALTLFCGLVHDFSSQLCLLMLACTAIEGALLAQDQNRAKILNLFCRSLCLLIFPLMMVIFVCYEMGYTEYTLFLPYVSIGGICATVIGTVSYFMYNPYRQVKKKLRGAKKQIEGIERTAEKQVRKNQKLRVKEEKIALKTRKKDEKKATKALARQTAKEEKQQKRLAKKERRKDRMDAFLAHFKKKAKAEVPSPDAMGTTLLPETAATGVLPIAATATVLPNAVTTAAPPNAATTATLPNTITTATPTNATPTATLPEAAATALQPETPKTIDAMETTDKPTEVDAGGLSEAEAAAAKEPEDNQLPFQGIVHPVS